MGRAHDAPASDGVAAQTTVSDPSTPTSDDPDAVALAAKARSQRADLRQALLGVESAVAAPVPGRVQSWRQAVHDALIGLRTAWERHLAVTEGPGGVLEDVMLHAPHLARAVEHIRSDHRVIEELLNEATTSARLMDPVPDAATAVREETLGVMEALVRHRGRGSDLMYDAYATDVGGSE